MTTDRLTLHDFQRFIETRYGERDRKRGSARTFMWLVEEVGELASALGETPPDRDELQGEFADVLGWLATLANMTGVDLEEAVRDKYLSDGGRIHKG